MRIISIWLLRTTVALTMMLPGIASAQSSQEFDRYGWGHHMAGWDGAWYGMIFGPIFMILLLALVIAIAVLLVRWLGGAGHAPSGHFQPQVHKSIDILKERYARGEIDKEEFEERRRVLGG